MSRAIHIRKLDRSDKPSFVQVLVKSFERDPLFSYLFGDCEQDQLFEGRAQTFVSFLFDKSFWLSEEIWGIYKGERLLGAYLIELPKVKVSKRFFGGLLLMGGVIQLCKKLSLNTIMKLNKYMKISRAAAPRYPHYYLVMIGVIPPEQGNGVGSKLIHHLLNKVRADHHAYGLALDTENKNNIEYYERLGFSLISTKVFEEVTIYSMIIKTNFNLT